MAIKGKGFVVTGVNDVMKNLGKLEQLNDPVIKQALFTEAELIMTASKRIVPWKNGDLSRSGHVEKPKQSGKMLSVEMGYNTEYALFQHEDLHWDKKKGRAVSMKLKHKGRGQPKYLEKPLMAVKNTIAAKLAKRIYKGWAKAQLANK